MEDVKTPPSESSEPADLVQSVSLEIEPCENKENPNQNGNLETVEIENLQISNKLTLKDTEPNSVQQVPVEPVDDPSSISEAGRFSLAAIFALSLSYLFGNKWDEDFCLRSIKIIVDNLHLPRKVESVMLQFMKGDVSQSTEPYVSLLYSEPYFQKEENLQTVIYDFVTLAVHNGKYDARWRVLIQHMAELFNIKRNQVDECERKLISCLLKKTTELTEDEKNKAANRKFSAKAKRYAWISLATIGGGALIGVTGGLAAPLIGAGFQLLGASAIAATLTSGIAATLMIGSLFGVAGGGLTGYKMHKRVGDIEEFEFHELNPVINEEDPNAACSSMNKPKELHVTIVISGWIKNKDEENYTKPWLNLLNGREQYYLKYESSYLMELGKAMEYIFSFVASFATQEVLKWTVLSGLLSAVSWPAGLLGLASVIDNPWGVCLRRSAQVGKQLAEVLLSRNQGHRPVTLMGYSLGARVIYYCLREMSNRKNCEGIIQDVILIGAPCTAQACEWTKFTRVVAGRIVNGYCRGDWLLRFLYRTLSVAVDGVAGLQSIELDNKKICNIDLTDLVTGHSDYPERMTEILSIIGVPLVENKTASDVTENKTSSDVTEIKTASDLKENETTTDSANSS